MIGSRAAARGCAWWQRSTTRPGRCSRGRTSSSRRVPPAAAGAAAATPAGPRPGRGPTGRFAIAAQNQPPAWRLRRAGQDLDRLCSFRYEATVLKDNTVRLSGLILDVPPGPRGRGYADRHVEVRQLLDGTWRVYLAERLIATAAAPTHRELRARRRRN